MNAESSVFIPLPPLCYSCPPIHLQHKWKKMIDFLRLGCWFANWGCSLRWWMVSGNTSLQKQDNSLYLSTTLDPKCLEIHIIREKWGWEKRILMRSSDLPFCPTYNASDRCLSHLFLTSGYGDSSLSLKSVWAVRKLSLMWNLNLLSGYWTLPTYAVRGHLQTLWTCRMLAKAGLLWRAKNRLLRTEIQLHVGWRRLWFHCPS